MSISSVIFNAVFIVVGMFLVLVLFYICMEVLPEWNRQRKVNRRIVRQAKAAGAWGKPEVLGGRALDIYAFEFCGLNRKPGETDKELRNRCRQSGFPTQPPKGGANHGRE